MFQRPKQMGFFPNESIIKKKFYKLKVKSYAYMLMDLLFQERFNK